MAEDHMALMKRLEYAIEQQPKQRHPALSIMDLMHLQTALGAQALEVGQTTRSRNGWEADCRVATINADDWRKKAEAAEARVRELEVYQNQTSETRTRLTNELREAQSEAAQMRAALEFYANPDTWFATSLLTDPPCGAIVDDFSEIDGRERLGKRARQAIANLPGEKT